MRKLSGSAPFDDFGAVTKNIEIKYFAVNQTVIFIIRKDCDQKREFKIYELNIKTYVYAMHYSSAIVMLFSTVKYLQKQNSQNPKAGRFG